MKYKNHTDNVFEENHDVEGKTIEASMKKNGKHKRGKPKCHIQRTSLKRFFANKKLASEAIDVICQISDSIVDRVSLEVVRLVKKSDMKTLKPRHIIAALQLGADKDISARIENTILRNLAKKSE